MSWSYDPAIPSDRDEVRLYVGDTDAANELVQDEEIDFLLDTHAQNAQATAADVCDIIAAKFSGLSSRTVGRVSVSYQNQYINYTKLSRKFRRQGAVPMAGGMGRTYLGPKDETSQTTTNIPAQDYTPPRTLPYPASLKP